MRSHPVWLEGCGFVQRVGSEAKSALGATLGWTLTTLLGNLKSPDPRRFFEEGGDQGAVCSGKMILMLVDE